MAKPDAFSTTPKEAANQYFISALANKSFLIQSSLAWLWLRFFFQSADLFIRSAKCPPLSTRVAILAAAAASKCH
jgi:hypothetical protein